MFCGFFTFLQLDEINGIKIVCISYDYFSPLTNEKNFFTKNSAHIPNPILYRTRNL